MSDPVRTDPAPRSEGPASLVSDVMRLSSDLVRKEIALAKAEVGQNLSRAGNAVGFIAVAGVIGLVTLNVLVAALVAARGRSSPPSVVRSSVAAVGRAAAARRLPLRCCCAAALPRSESVHARRCESSASVCCESSSSRSCAVSWLPPASSARPARD